jgi:hypothetical protein
MWQLAAAAKPTACGRRGGLFHLAAATQCGSLTAYAVSTTPCFRLLRRLRRGRRVKDAENKNPTELNSVRFLVLATSYSRTACRRTTIGAAAFHFRVRNGNGWDHCAIVTRVRNRTRGFAAAAATRARCRTLGTDCRSFKRTIDSLISTYRSSFRLRTADATTKASFVLRSFVLSVCRSAKRGTG